METPTPSELAYIIRMAEQARREHLTGQSIATWLQMHANDVDTATWVVNDLKRRLNRAYDNEHSLQHIEDLELSFADACENLKEKTAELVEVIHKTISDHYALLATTSLQKR